MVFGLVDCFVFVALVLGLLLVSLICLGLVTFEGVLIIVYGVFMGGL